MQHGTTVALDVDKYLAATASTGAVGHDVANTIALGENSVVDANEDGLLVTATYCWWMIVLVLFNYLCFTF
jgi:hypothetical protein